MLTGASIAPGEGIVCGAGPIVDGSRQLKDDETYSVWSPAHEAVGPGVFDVLPASGDHAEGLSFEDISTDPFDCGDMTL